MRSELIVPTSLIAQHNTRHKGCQSLRSDHVVPTSLIAQHNPLGRPHTRVPHADKKRNLGENTATCSEQAPVLSASQNKASTTTANVSIPKGYSHMFSDSSCLCNVHLEGTSRFTCSTAAAVVYDIYASCCNGLLYCCSSIYELLCSPPSYQQGRHNNRAAHRLPLHAPSATLHTCSGS